LDLGGTAQSLLNETVLVVIVSFLVNLALYRGAAQHRERLPAVAQAHDSFESPSPSECASPNASAHYWAREIEKLGHKVRLIGLKFVRR
jgi:hypothetical protein